jgi:hypothetical protein
VAGGAANDRAQIVVAQRLFPLRAPCRRAGRHGGAFHRTAVGSHLADIAAADETEAGMIEIIAVELVDAHADRAGGDERIEVEFLVVEKSDRGRGRLMGEIAADLSLAGLRVVGRADARQQQELDVEKLERAQQHDVGRLFPFFARRIHVADAGGPLAGAVEIDAHHLALGAGLEIRLAQQRRQNGRLRARLGIIGAAEPFAEAAKGALPEPDAERIGVSLREISRRLRVWFVAELLGGLREQGVPVALLHRRRRIGPRATAFEQLPPSWI